MALPKAEIKAPPPLTRARLARRGPRLQSRHASQPATDRRALLASTAVFGHLKRHELEALLEEMAWFLLPGGGARGFAQIGVVQALRESGITAEWSAPASARSWRRHRR